MAHLNSKRSLILCPNNNEVQTWKVPLTWQWGINSMTFYEHFFFVWQSIETIQMNKSWIFFVELNLISFKKKTLIYILFITKKINLKMKRANSWEEKMLFILGDFLGFYHWNMVRELFERNKVLCLVCPIKKEREEFAKVIKT